jgi:hypothetical protein
MSLLGTKVLAMRRVALAAIVLMAALSAGAQYPGQVAKSSKDAPELLSIAVLEWTGEAGKPTASRLVPVAVLDGGELQDGGIYLARPEPLALAGEVEYELQQNGQPVGLYNIKNAGQEQGSWVGYGSWNPLPVARPKPSAEELAKIKIDDENSDQPVLHRKKHPEDAAGGKAGGATGSASDSPAPVNDPDRPVLHKKSSSDSDANQGASGSSGSSNPSADPDRPVLHKAKKQPEDVAHTESLPDVTDPDRPRLKRGKSNSDALNVIPSLMGLPPEMGQAIAVSDIRSRPAHPWSYAWANPDDEDKMKSALENIAREALGLNPPLASAAPRRASARKSAKPATLPPARLVDEQFRVFELAYGSGATLVLSARTDGAKAQQKVVTLIAQPDLYGNLLVLLKSVADGAHLDDTPRMRLVDAVDALADNRGELLFELRGATQRQFALYRVMRGQAERLFVTGGAEFSSATSK